MVTNSKPTKELPVKAKAFGKYTSGATWSVETIYTFSSQKNNIVYLFLSERNHIISFDPEKCIRSHLQSEREHLQYRRHTMRQEVEPEMEDSRWGTAQVQLTVQRRSEIVCAREEEEEGRRVYREINTKGSSWHTDKEEILGCDEGYTWGSCDRGRWKQMMDCGGP